MEDTAEEIKDGGRGDDHGDRREGRDGGVGGAGGRQCLCFVTPAARSSSIK